MSVHSNERAFVCLFCGKGFGTQKNLTNHVKVCYLASAQLGGLGLLDSVEQNEEPEEV